MTLIKCSSWQGCIKILEKNGKSQQQTNICLQSCLHSSFSDLPGFAFAKLTLNSKRVFELQAAGFVDEYQKNKQRSCPFFVLKINSHSLFVAEIGRIQAQLQEGVVEIGSGSAERIVLLPGGFWGYAGVVYSDILHSLGSITPFLSNQELQN